MAAAQKKMRLDVAGVASTSRSQELPGPVPNPSSSPALQGPAPTIARGLPLYYPSAESSNADFVVDLTVPTPPACSSPPLPLSADHSGQAPASKLATVPHQSPSRPPKPLKVYNNPSKEVPHYRVPVISSKVFKSAPCPPSSKLSRGYRDGSPVIVPLTELERDQHEVRPYLSESIVHLDGLGLPRFRSVLGENPIASADLSSYLGSTGSVPLWSCSVGGVDFVLSCGLPAEEDEIRLLTRLFAKCQLHIAPRARVIQKPGSPACAWLNKDWCIGCGGEWHPLGLCPLVIRVVREMVEKGMEVNFDDGFCVKCGYIGHNSDYCQARLDRTMQRLWQAYCARKRRWSCLDVVYFDIQLPPLAKALQSEGCTRDLPPPGQPSKPLPLCVRCSRPTGETRELLQEVLERQRGEERKRLERERLQGDGNLPLSRFSELTRLPEELSHLEHAALAAQDPMYLLSWISASQNWWAYMSQELAQLEHQLARQVRRTESLSFGGFPIPPALPLLVPAGADEEAWRSEVSRPSSNKRRSPPEELRDPHSRGTVFLRQAERRPSASSRATPSRSSGGHGPPSSSRPVVASRLSP
ncbi:hypothetical protein Emed_001912 [Eimeria media]